MKSKLVNQFETYDWETKVLPFVKRHMRIGHELDDELLVINIKVAARNIWTNYMCKNIYDFTGSDKQLVSNYKLAIAHLVTSYRENPDENNESAGKVIHNRQVERILGGLVGYPYEESENKN